MQIATVDLASGSGVQTNTALITARTDKQLVIYGVYISSDAATEVHLSNSVGHEDIYKQFVAANGGSVNVAAPYPLALPTWGEGLDYTTTAAADLWMSILYEFR